MTLETRQIHDLITRSWERSADSHLVNEWPYRIYGRADASIWAIVDEEDYQWAQQWLWSYAMSPRGKIYIKRNTGNALVTKNRKIIGRIRGKQKSIYLHREIIKRAEMIPPSEDHKIGEHKDGNSLNCRRNNLEWITIGENNRRGWRNDPMIFVDSTKF